MINLKTSMSEKFSKEVYPLTEETSERRLRQCLENDEIDLKFGFKRITDQKEQTGFLINMHTTEIIDEDKRLHSAVDYYFIEEDGNRFKVSYPYNPYFYVLTKKDTIQEVSKFLLKKYNGVVENIKIVAKEDLDLPNHLVGLKQRFLKLSFVSITDLLKVRRDILAAVRKSRERSKTNSLYSEMLNNDFINNEDKDYLKKVVDQFDNIIDIREYDVPYHIRVSIDNKIFIGCWYSVKPRGQNFPPLITRRKDLIETPDFIVLAFDIECTKQPLKFPDSETDQIIMISYMIDGQGYLINNREIMSQDVDDFEYTPMPEFEGNFIVYNEPNEKALLRRFFDHINDIKPHVIVTYNGDYFDWPFVENRASFHALSMKGEIGFSKSKDGVYSCRPISHMDCLCWVKRDSYLPVGSHNLKAVAKAKLRYDPVELDPEDMCRLAAEEPQVLANYSVSDAVATYYLYMKYVHPFIFALCTILPMEPDEVLRKGSGTLCEALLMVEAYQSNIIFPNKQESELNKMTADGHVLESETYVGGHVEALESGVFRADIPCRFRLVPEAFDKLIEEAERVMTHAIEKEEKVPLSSVTNFDEILCEIREKLKNLRDNPVRTENPVIYHLDVGAMYPNIILTNRLQPYAIVNEEICAACDFNRPGATCQRKMTWMWRGEFMPATRNEFQRIQQQLETEKFPPDYPGGPARAFHQLTKEEQASYEKKRLTEYCRKAYKKLHVTRMEEIESNICQKENSFYVGTVRAFRDRRYEYKGLSKQAKKEVIQAVAKGDAGEIKSAKNREVLYDSLQLAHKCILNSFYGYVMRKGARWFSMEMAGIVCHTGAAIITRAREIIEQVGRPLELDTDGIWCVLPKSFPENFDVTTNLDGKKKITVSYPNAVLNCMVQEHFTNHAYHDLVDPDTLKYVQRSENSIFFEVDGPYLAMVLPASKEEGKKLKKRYAVFNFDKSLAELKGFEVKRRGELQLIKIFQSSVFEAFLKGNTLEKCYEAVGKVADYWLDILYSKAVNLTDSELFDLISENRSMSKKLEDYGSQKSTSISTAKRLAEFLGDQMIKDKGLACRYIISRKPEGSPVTERAIPLAIFQSEPSIKRHYLRKWLKDNSITDVDIRQVLDWNYYIERLNGAIQKIITIPAALQGLNNPVPRVRHPDWLHKKILEKNDVLKQRKLNEFFSAKEKEKNVETRTSIPLDIEDTIMKETKSLGAATKRPIVTKRKRDSSHVFDDNQLQRDWRTVLGPPPPLGKTKEERLEWIKYHKKKWELQRHQRNYQTENCSKKGRISNGPSSHIIRQANTLSNFIKKAQRNVLESYWQVIQFAETNEPGLFKVWALVEKELHVLKLYVPRIFYVNQRTPKNENETNRLWKKANRLLPRSRPIFYLYEYAVPEDLYREHGHSNTQRRTNGFVKTRRFAKVTTPGIISGRNTETDALLSFALKVGMRRRKTLRVGMRVHALAPLKLLRTNPRFIQADRGYVLVRKKKRDPRRELMADLSTPEIEGIYETQVPLEFRVLLLLECICSVDRNVSQKLSRQGMRDTDSFNLDQLSAISVKDQRYLQRLPDGSLPFKTIFFYHHRSSNKEKAFYGIFLGPSKRAFVFVQDTVKTNQMPNLNTLYDNKRSSRIANETDETDLPPSGITFEVQIMTDKKQIFRSVQKCLQNYKDEKRGPTVLLLQSFTDTQTMVSQMPGLGDFPIVTIYSKDSENLFLDLQWQKIVSKYMIERYINSESVFNTIVEQCRYFRIPIGNLPADATLFGADLFYGRYLLKNNFVLWCSQTDLPDLGGRESDDGRLLTDFDESSTPTINQPGCYSSVVVELDVESLAVNTLMQSHRVNEVEGTSSSVAFDAAPQVCVDEMIGGHGPLLTSYDETALCSSAFKVIRAMVNSWLRDVSVGRNVYADYQVVHFYRWLRSTNALFYDPALRRTLLTLMKKLFFLLVGEFKRLGAIVVFANFNKIIICTKKHSIRDALGYADFVVTSIRNKELFHSIQITYSRSWNYLMWLDIGNYAGIKGKLPAGVTEGLTEDIIESGREDPNEEEEDEVRDQQFRLNFVSHSQPDSDNAEPIVMNWNLARCLPSAPIVQNNFIEVIAGYINTIWSEINKQARGPRTPNKRRMIGSQSQIPPTPLGVGVHETVKDCAKHLIESELSQKLFSVVQKIHRKLPVADETSLDIPRVPGARAKQINPALEFTKAVCKVLSLDDAITEDVARLKRNMLKLINIGEFSDMAEWSDPCLTIVLPEIICKVCNHCRDIDLCKDEHRFDMDDKSYWQCPVCQSKYDNDDIEYLLLDTIQRKSMAYVLQDLQCKKCMEIKADNLREYCECAGHFKTLIQPQTLFTHFKILQIIGHQFKMPLLLESVEWMIKMNPSFNQ